MVWRTVFKKGEKKYKQTKISLLFEAKREKKDNDYRINNSDNDNVETVYRNQFK